MAIETISNQTKTCTVCKQEKPAQDCIKSQNLCKECKRIKDRSYLKRRNDLEKSAVYRIRNISDGMLYIGGTTLLKNRKRQHFEALRRGDHRNKSLQTAWNDHGEKSFVFEVLEIIENKNDVISIEQKYLDEAIANNLAYNHCPDAASMRGFIMPSDAVERIAIHKRGKKRSLNSIKKQCESLRKWHSVPENKQKHSDGLKGHKVSDECRRKISETNKGRPVPYERRLKISETLTGRRLNADQKLARRRKHGKIKEEDIKQIIKLRNEGMSFRAIGKIFGTSHEPIRKNYYDFRDIFVH